MPYIYLIEIRDADFIKLGFTRRTIPELCNDYSRSYGKPLMIVKAVEIQDPEETKALEGFLHIHLQNLGYSSREGIDRSGELYQKKYLGKIEEVLKKHVGTMIYHDPCAKVERMGCKLQKKKDRDLLYKQEAERVRLAEHTELLELRSLVPQLKTKIVYMAEERISSAKRIVSLQLKVAEQRSHPVLYPDPPCLVNLSRMMEGEQESRLIESYFSGGKCVHGVAILSIDEKKTLVRDRWHKLRADDFETKLEALILGYTLHEMDLGWYCFPL